MAEQTVVCPKCGHRFPVTKALTGQIEDSLRHEFEARAKEQEKATRAVYEKRLAAEQKRLEKQVTVRAQKASAVQVARLRSLLSSGAKREKATKASFARQLVAERSRLEREAIKGARAAVSTQVADLRKQIRAREAAIQDMQDREAAVQQREKQLKAREQNIQKAIEATRKKTIEETSETIEKEYHTRELQHQKVVSDLKKQLPTRSEGLSNPRNRPKGK